MGKVYKEPRVTTISRVHLPVSHRPIGAISISPGGRTSRASRYRRPVPRYVRGRNRPRVRAPGFPEGSRGSGDRSADR